MFFESQKLLLTKVLLCADAKFCMQALGQKLRICMDNYLSPQGTLVTKNVIQWWKWRWDMGSSSQQHT